MFNSSERRKWKKIATFGLIIMTLTNFGRSRRIAQKKAAAFAGEAAPPCRFKGKDVKWKVQRRLAMAYFVTASRSNISPIGKPKRARSPSSEAI